MSEKRSGQESSEFPSEIPSEFEIQLAGALRPVDAPEGFAARVMERAAAPAVSSKVVVMRPRWAVRGWAVHGWAVGAIAAMLAVGAFVGEQVHVRHQREQAAVATQQFEAASRIEDKVLQQTRERLAKAGVPLN
jgi:hypothetical protein